MMDLNRGNFEDFVEFNQRMYHRRKGIKQSIEFKLSAPSTPSTTNGIGYFKVVSDKNDRIIGQFQRIPCKYYFEGREFEAFWGMDYIVEEESRGSAAGVFLAKDALKDAHFGMGLSPISFKIHLLLGEECIGECSKFIRFNSLFSLFRLGLALASKKQMKLPHIGDRIFPALIRLNRDTIFGKVSDYISMNWEPESKKRIEFARNADFMDWRFGSYPHTFKCYALYDNQSLLAYFVCRYVIWKGARFLLLVDYRFKDEHLDALFKAINKLSRLSKALGIITLSSYGQVDSFLRRKGYTRFGKNGKIVTNVKPGFSKEEIEQRRSIMVTFADSDGDFFYGNKEWYEYE